MKLIVILRGESSEKCATESPSSNFTSRPLLLKLLPQLKRMQKDEQKTRMTSRHRRVGLNFQK